MITRVFAKIIARFFPDFRSAGTVPAPTPGYRYVLAKDIGAQRLSTEPTSRSVGAQGDADLEWQKAGHILTRWCPARVRDCRISSPGHGQPLHCLAPVWGYFATRAVGVSAVDIAHQPLDNVAVAVANVLDRGLGCPSAVRADFHFSFETRHQVVLPVAM